MEAKGQGISNVVPRRVLDGCRRVCDPFLGRILGVKRGPSRVRRSSGRTSGPAATSHVPATPCDAFVPVDTFVGVSGSFPEENVGCRELRAFRAARKADGSIRMIGRMSRIGRFFRPLERVDTWRRMAVQRPLDGCASSLYERRGGGIWGVLGEGVPRRVEGINRPT